MITYIKETGVLKMVYWNQSAAMTYVLVFNLFSKDNFQAPALSHKPELILPLCKIMAFYPLLC